MKTKVGDALNLKGTGKHQHLDQERVAELIVSSHLHINSFTGDDKTRHETCQRSDLGFAKSMGKPFFSQMKSTGGIASAWQVSSAVLVPSPLLATFLHWAPFCSSGLTTREEMHIQHMEK